MSAIRPRMIIERLRAAGVIVGEELARILAERGHPLADRALVRPWRRRIASICAWSARKLLQPLAWTSSGVQRRGRAGLQHPGIISIAVRQLPDAGVGRRMRALAGELGDLAVERRRDLLGDEPLGAAAEIARHGGGAPRERGDQPPGRDRRARAPCAAGARSCRAGNRARPRRAPRHGRGGRSPRPAPPHRLRAGRDRPRHRPGVSILWLLSSMSGTSMKAPTFWATA